jgi:hypothetical protein
MLEEATMTMTLDRPPETEAALVAQAEAHGLSLDAFLRSVIATHAAAIEPAKFVQALPRDSDDLDGAIDDLFDAIPIPPGVGEWAMRRENWYR